MRRRRSPAAPASVVAAPKTRQVGRFSANSGSARGWRLALRSGSSSQQPAV
jgi:hypothetical protein